jgi:hypothetical protein
MAQPVYYEHPLEEYLRRQRQCQIVVFPHSHLCLESGEGERMPGAPLEFAAEDDIEANEQDGEVLELLPPAVRQIFEVRRLSTGVACLDLTQHRLYAHSHNRIEL